MDECGCILRQRCPKNRTEIDLIPLFDWLIVFVLNGGGTTPRPY